MKAHFRATNGFWSCQRRAGYPGAPSRGWDKTDFNRSFSLDLYLRKMIDTSDTASTDKLFAWIEAREGAGALVRWAKSSAEVGAFNVGELTSICELDRRIRNERNTCATERDGNGAYRLRCAVLEDKSRNSSPSAGTVVPASSWENDCMNKYNGSGTSWDAAYARYYRTLANAMTPAEWGRFWKRLDDHALLAWNPETRLINNYLRLNSNERNFFPNDYQTWGGKGGDKHKMKSWVGYGSTPVSDGTRFVADGRWAVGVFTENFSEESAAADTRASNLITTIIQNAIPFLR